MFCVNSMRKIFLKERTMARVRFDTEVQYLKYRVLKEVAKNAFEGTLLDKITDIPKTIVPGKKPTMRCCVYKERAILSERVKLAVEAYKTENNVIEVIDIACDDCPIGGYEVSNACRGCLSRRCKAACKVKAISFDENMHAVIDKEKCIECGACAKVCPYSAIRNYKRPCENACKIGAVSMGEDREAEINREKCTSCGACVYQCPFGAITDRSYILEAVEIIKNSENNTKYPVVAVVAPSIAGQYKGYTNGQVVAGMKKLGFSVVVEAALGADMVAMKEAEELAEKGFLLSSCCPSFVSYVKKQFPMLADKLSENISPAAYISKKIKESMPDAKVIFVGPCTAKKEEYKQPHLKKYVDTVLTFEELQAMFGSREIDLADMEEDKLTGASYYGRVFARSGGLVEAVKQALKEQKRTDFEFKPISCNGIEECRLALLRASKGVLDANFIEGMACVGGCIGGAGCITHEEKNRVMVDKYGRESHGKKMAEVIAESEY